MTIKNIALALLAVPAMANQHCEPEAAQPHFSVELAGGGCTMNGHVQSKTTNPDIPTPTFETVSFAEAASQNIDAFTATIPMDVLMGYRANWHKMIPLPSQMGFAGQINMHWNYMCNGMGAGLYAGIGYNASRSSSTIPASFDPTIQSYIYDDTRALDAGTTFDVYQEDLVNMDNNASMFPLQNRVQKTKNTPMGKATISSGLMFQAGTRLGAMIGNVFPHVRLGWACYQFKAHMTNQHAPWMNQVAAQAKSNPDVMINADSRAIPIIADGQMVSIGVGQYMDAFDDAYKTNNPIKIASKSQWTNAVTIGAGVDWAFNRMTLGFFYQVGICQKLTFKKWNKDVTAGLTAVHADYIGSQDVQLDINPTPTGGSLNMHYDKRTPEVSIAPVMHTAMVSVKYVLGKAA